MNKKEDTQEETTEEDTTEEAKPEVKPSVVSLAEVPTQMGLVYRTPEGDMGQEQYLVWLGNLILELKEAVAGN